MFKKIIILVLFSIFILSTYFYVYNLGKKYAYTQMFYAENCICILTVYDKLRFTLSKDQKELLKLMVKEDCQPVMKRKI